MSVMRYLMTAVMVLAAACSQKDEAAPEPAAVSVEAGEATASQPPADEPVAEPAFDASAAPSGAYANDPGHSYIAFSYNHMGYSNPIARWGAWTATLDWNAEDPARSGVVATIDVASIDTGVDALDEHLLSTEFFDAAQFPTIAFKSTALEITGANTGRLKGDLTIKDATRPVTLDVTINRAADDGFAKAYKLGFSAKGAISRSEFGIGLYVPMVSDEVAITIEAEFIQPKEPAAQ